MASKRTLKTWLKRCNGVEIETRELAETLVDAKGAPALRDAPALCAAAQKLLSALDEFDRELEAVGYGG